MSLETLRLLDGLATDPSEAPFNRAFAEVIFLTTYTFLRSPDVQWLRTFEGNADSIFGTLLTCSAKKQHGQFFPRARPRIGITDSTAWIQPLLEMRACYIRQKGTDMSFDVMRVGRDRHPISAEAASYSAERRKLAHMCVAPGDPEGARYTTHSPKDLFPTASNQMRCDQRELNIIGHWPFTSRMPGRYGRILRANELLPRNTIMAEMRQGWDLAPAFGFPAAATGNQRIGKDEFSGAIPAKLPQTGEPGPVVDAQGSQSISQQGTGASQGDGVSEKDGATHSDDTEGEDVDGLGDNALNGEEVS